MPRRLKIGRDGLIVSNPRGTLFAESFDVFFLSKADGTGEVACRTLQKQLTPGRQECEPPPKFSSLQEKADDSTPSCSSTACPRKSLYLANIKLGLSGFDKIEISNSISCFIA